MTEKQKRIISRIVLVVTFFAIFLGCFAVVIMVGDRTILTYINGVSNLKTRDLEIFKDNEGCWNIKNDATNADFKILNISDIHLSCGTFTYDNDVAAVDSVVKLVKQNSPDLIVLLGDINSPIWIRSWCTNAKLQTKAIAMLFTKMGIPWTVVFGNHDDEGNLTRQQLGDFYENVDGCLFSKGSENVYGVGNYVIKLLNNDGTFNSGLVCMDSNSYGTDTRYQHFTKSQIDWYEAEILKLNEQAGYVAKTLLFMHIPFIEYREAWDLYNSGSDEVVFVGGDKGEGISQTPKTGFFEKLVSLSSTKNVFCGHNHKNNYTLIYKDVALTFNAVIDTSVYFNAKNRTDYRGGTVVSINTNSDVFVNRAMQINDFKTTNKY